MIRGKKPPNASASTAQKPLFLRPTTTMSPPKRTWSTIATGTTLFLVLFVALHHQQLADLASGSPSRPTPGALLRVIPDPGKDRGLAACDVANLRYIGKDTITGCRALDPPQPTLLRAAESVRWVAAYGDSLTRSPVSWAISLPETWGACKDMLMLGSS